MRKNRYFKRFIVFFITLFVSFSSLVPVYAETSPTPDPDDPLETFLTPATLAQKEQWLSDLFGGYGFTFTNSDGSKAILKDWDLKTEFTDEFNRITNFFDDPNSLYMNLNDGVYNCAFGFANTIATLLAGAGQALGMLEQDITKVKVDPECKPVSLYSSDGLIYDPTVSSKVQSMIFTINTGYGFYNDTFTGNTFYSSQSYFSVENQHVLIAPNSNAISFYRFDGTVNFDGYTSGYTNYIGSIGFNVISSASAYINVPCIFKTAKFSVSQVFIPVSDFINKYPKLLNGNFNSLYYGPLTSSDYLLCNKLSYAGSVLYYVPNVSNYSSGKLCTKQDYEYFMASYNNAVSHEVTVNAPLTTYNINNFTNYNTTSVVIGGDTYYTYNINYPVATPDPTPTSVPTATPPGSSDPVATPDPNTTYVIEGFDELLEHVENIDNTTQESQGLLADLVNSFNAYKNDVMKKLDDIIKAINSVSIENITENTGTNIWDFLIELLKQVFGAFGAVLTKLADILIGFIIPTDSTLDSFNGLFDSLKKAMGILYSPFEIIEYTYKTMNDTFVSLNSSGAVSSFNWPDIQVLNTTIIPAGSFSLNDVLIDSNFNNMYNLYLLIVDGVVWFGFFNLLYRKVKGWFN